MKIIGAGISGLLAANMLRHHQPRVYEAQASLPHNHSAVLRFRSEVIGQVTGIPFKKVRVIKASLPWTNPVADNLAYAEKCNAMMVSNRSIPTEVEVVERYIAPPDLVNQLATRADIRFGEHDVYPERDGPTISTIPMPHLMSILNYKGERPSFHAMDGVNLRAVVTNCDAYVSLYVPNPFYPFSRITLTGAELIVELPQASINPDDPDECEPIFAAASLLGIDKWRLNQITAKAQSYSKIQEIDEHVRKTFISWASDTHGVYSLGRYACWRPGLLLDDLVQDIRLIEGWMYTRKKTHG